MRNGRRSEVTKVLESCVDISVDPCPRDQAVGLTGILGHIADDAVEAVGLVGHPLPHTHGQPVFADTLETTGWAVARQVIGERGVVTQSR